MDFDEVGPWQELVFTPLFRPHAPQPKLLKHTNTMTTLDFRQTRSRVKSMDTTNQRQVLKMTPVRQLCDFKISKELLMSRNNTVFPKQSVPRSFLYRKKTQQMRKHSSQELNPAMAIQIQKIEELVKNQLNKVSLTAAKRISDVKYQRFLNTQF